jgi:hypothetical protein
MLAALCFIVGVTATAGGLTLVLRPDGSLLQLPLSTLEHSPFSSFFVPGILLLVVIGGGNLLAGALIMRGSRHARVVAFAAGTALCVWIVTQVLLLRAIEGLQVMFLAAGLVVAAAALRRRRWVGLAAMLVVGCADHAMWRSEYDDVARIAGAQLATPERGGEVGALADSVTIARGDLPKGFNYDTSGLITGFHAGVAYRYYVMCTEGTDRAAMCGPEATHALAIATWEGTLVLPSFTTTIRRQATWRLANLGGAMGTASGSSTLLEAQAVVGDRSYAVTDQQDMLLFVDMASHDMMAGSMRTELVVTTDPDDDWGHEHDVTADVTFTGPGSALLVLDDDFSYAVDLATGAVTRR